MTEYESDDSSDGLEDLLARALDISSSDTASICVEDNTLIAWARERSTVSRSRIGKLGVSEGVTTQANLSDCVSALARHALGVTEQISESGVYADAFGTYVRWVHSCSNRPSELTLKDVLLDPGRVATNLAEAQVYIARYSVFLYEQQIKASSLVTALRNLKYAFYLRGSMSADSLFSAEHNPFLSLALRGSRFTAEEEKELMSRRIARKPDAILSNMQESLRTTLWIRTVWNTDSGMDKKGAYVCLMLGIDFALRPSNLLRGDKRLVRGIMVRNPHVLLASEVQFVLNSDLEAVEERVSAALLREHLKIPDGTFVNETDLTVVSHCLFRILTTKSTTMVSAVESTEAASRIRYLGRRTPMEECHLLAFTCWCINTGVVNEEPIFARVGPQSHRRRYITKRDIVNPLKVAAVELGLDPTLYSARSMRVTYASVATAAAVPMAEMNRVGWSSQSNVAQTVYSRAIGTRNTSAVMIPTMVDEIERSISQSGKTQNSSLGNWKRS